MRRYERPTMPLPFPAEKIADIVPPALNDIIGRNTTTYGAGRSRTRTEPMPIGW
jgi:hypothetical protein